MVVSTSFLLIRGGVFIVISQNVISLKNPILKSVPKTTVGTFLLDRLSRKHCSGGPKSRSKLLARTCSLQSFWWENPFPTNSGIPWLVATSPNLCLWFTITLSSMGVCLLSFVVSNLLQPLSYKGACDTFMIYLHHPKFDHIFHHTTS